MTRRHFLLLFLLTLPFRFWLAAAMPITGDEAYFIWWGWIPDWGFYDHPPMIGWWLALLLKFGDAEWWLRTPTILLPGAMALATGHALRERGETLAWGTAALVLLAPMNVWNVFVTTDTPLVYFIFFSGLAFLRATRDDDGRFYFLAGLLLAGAVLSKYFAALLGFAYLLHVLVRPNRHKWLGLLLCYAPAIPALLLMAWWNSGHCWPNYMFNFVNRHGDAGWSWKTPLLYGVMMLYLLTPSVVWLLMRQRAALAATWVAAPSRALWFIAAVPLALFGVLSLFKQIGLHWVLAFIPFVLIALAGLLDVARLRRVIRVFIGVAIVHVLVIGAVARMPLETWQSTRQYDGIVLTFETQKLLDRLKPFAQDYVFASDGFSNAVTLGYDARRYFLVFGEASSHARHDDILTDFRALDGRNILILRKTPPDPAYYARYFHEVEIREFNVRGVTFHIVLGRGFRYPVYRDEVLSWVRGRYYAIPAWLPQNGCYFCDRYFPGTPCCK